MRAIARQYQLRRFGEKLRRRIRQLAGRPDNTPWILDGHPPRRTAHVDFLFGLDYLSPNARLVRIFHEAMSAYGLSLLLVNQSNVSYITRQIERGWLHPHLYVDLCSYPGNPFENIVFKAAERGIPTLIRPEHMRWCFKADTHGILQQAGLPVPPSVIFRKDDPDRELSDEERARVGEHCVIKPTYGVAAQGVVIDVAPTKVAIAAARDYRRDWDWLVQKMIRPIDLGDRWGYLRAYHVCGHRTLLWWSRDDGTGRGGYSLLTWRDLERYDLYGVIDILDRLAKLTQMDFFSTEIAITAASGPDRFCLIDYLNDQCDMDPTALANFSPPEAYSRWACQRFAEYTWRLKRNIPADPYPGLFLWNQEK